MPCSTVSSLAISTRSSAYFTVWIICPPMLKSPSPSRASLVRHSLYKLNRIGDKQRPCWTPLPICTILVSSRSSRTLTLWSTYNLLINLLHASRYQFSLGSALIWSSFGACLLPAYEVNTQSFIYLQSSFRYYSHHPNCIPSSYGCNLFI